MTPHQPTEARRWALLAAVVAFLLAALSSGEAGTSSVKSGKAKGARLMHRYSKVGSQNPGVAPLDGTPSPNRYLEVRRGFLHKRRDSTGVYRTETFDGTDTATSILVGTRRHYEKQTWSRDAYDVTPARNYFDIISWESSGNTSSASYRVADSHSITDYGKTSSNAGSITETVNPCAVFREPGGQTRGRSWEGRSRSESHSTGYPSELHAAQEFSDGVWKGDTSNPPPFTAGSATGTFMMFIPTLDILQRWDKLTATEASDLDPFQAGETISSETRHTVHLGSPYSHSQFLADLVKAVPPLPVEKGTETVQPDLLSTHFMATNAPLGSAGVETERYYGAAISAGERYILAENGLSEVNLGFQRAGAQDAEYWFETDEPEETAGKSWIVVFEPTDPNGNVTGPISIEGAYSWEPKVEATSKKRKLFTSALLARAVPVTGRYVLHYVELKVDGNRNGEMSFDTTVLGNDDQTSAARPFRFWLNNDYDKGDTVDLTDWEEDDHNSDHDRTNDVIEWRRDLEDFTRLWISFKGITEMVKQSDFRVKLEWKPMNGGTSWPTDDGNPGIRVFKAVEQDGERQYLEDDGVAWQQLDGAQGPNGHSNFSKALGTNGGLVTRNSIVELPASFFSDLSESQPNRYLLFEGYSAGKGQLILTLHKGGQKIGEYPPLYLELKDAKDMYETWGVGDAQNPGIDWNVWPAATPTLFPTPSGRPLAPPPDETKDCIVFVHGWQMSRADKDAFADTTFKRLWHRGFKGRFVAYRWPTFYEMSASNAVAHFDASEQRAWNSGNGLVWLADNLNGREFNGRVRVMGHSHGNLVVGATLRQAGNRRIFHTYVASQAAIAAHCYNPATPLMNFNSNPKTTPNVYGYYWVPGTTLYPDDYQGAGYPPLLHPTAMQGAAGKFVNYYNPSDWALGFWQIDQQTKPNAGYDYLANPPGSPGVRTFVHNVLRPSYRMLSFPQDTYEIYSYAAEAHSFPLGRSATVGGVFDNNAEVNLDARWSYGDKHKGHSAQFRSTNMLRWEYWEELLGTFGIRQQ